MDEDERELERLRVIIAAWRRSPSELWLVANSVGDDDAAVFVRQLYANLTPLAEQLSAMLDSGDPDLRAEVARAVYAIQTKIAGAYVDAQHEIEGDDVKLDELQARDNEDIAALARILHDNAARWLTATNNPHPTWDHCNDDHRASYEQEARASIERGRP
jgi:hypothetical protein